VFGDCQVGQRQRGTQRCQVLGHVVSHIKHSVFLLSLGDRQLNVLVERTDGHSQRTHRRQVRTEALQRVMFIVDGLVPERIVLGECGSVRRRLAARATNDGGSAGVAKLRVWSSLQGRPS
jgi:hypothetical protein